VQATKQSRGVREYCDSIVVCTNYRLALAGGRRRRVLVVQAYLDESGTDDRWPYVTVAGWIGSHAEWSKFEAEWRKTLVGAGIGVFHATEHHSLWPQMVRAIKRRKIKGFVVTVLKRAYKTAVTQKAKNVSGNAYSISAQACVHGMAQWAKGKGHGKSLFTLESGQPNVDFVRRRLEALQEDDSFGIAGVSVAKKKESVPLQAADFLAHIFATYERSWMLKIIGDAYGRALHQNYDEPALVRLSAKHEWIAKTARHIREKQKGARKQMKKASLS